MMVSLSRHTGSAGEVSPESVEAFAVCGFGRLNLGSDPVQRVGGRRCPSVRLVGR